MNTKLLAEMVKLKRKGLTLEMVSEQSGISESTISRIESERGTPDAPVLVKIAAWLGVPVGRFYDSEPNIDKSDTPIIDKISKVILADEKLTKPERHELNKFFVIAYNAFTNARENVEVS